MTRAVFLLTVASLVLGNVLLLISIVSPAWRFWPPPEPRPMRVHLLDGFGLRAPLTTLAVFALGVLDWQSLGAGWLLVRVLGGLAFAAGGGFALWGYFGLGPSASQGHYEGLVASGAYRFSRNPQYVGTIVCMFGLALATNSLFTLVAAGLWAVWFLLAPFAEEPWMRAHLGPGFDRYAEQVPRYLGWPRVGAAAR